MLDADGIAGWHDDEATAAAASRHRIDGERHHIEVDSCRADDDHAITANECLCNTRHGIFDILPRNGRRDRFDALRTDQAWISHEATTQRSLLRQQV